MSNQKSILPLTSQTFLGDKTKPIKSAGDNPITGEPSPLMDTSQGLNAALLDLLCPFPTKSSETRSPDSDISNLRPISFANLQRRIEGPQVCILVGPELAKFILPRRLLCDASPFFGRAFLGGFSEAKSQSMNLPDADSESFLTIVIELLTGNFRFRTEGNDNKSDFAEYRYGLMPLVKIYILASKLLLSKAQNRSFSELVKPLTPLWSSVSLGYTKSPENLSYTVSPATLRLILDETPERCELQTFMLNNLWTILEAGKEHASIYEEIFRDHPTITRDFLGRSLNKIRHYELEHNRKKEIAEAESKRQAVNNTPAK